MKYIDFSKINPQFFDFVAKPLPQQPDFTQQTPATAFWDRNAPRQRYQAIYNATVHPKTKATPASKTLNDNPTNEKSLAFTAGLLVCSLLLESSLKVPNRHHHLEPA